MFRSIGKSSTRQKVTSEIGLQSSDFVLIDVDEFKVPHCTYCHYHYEKKDFSAADRVHRASSKLARALLQSALDVKSNIVYDATLKSVSTATEILDAATKNGYQILMHAVYETPWKCVSRAIRRAIVSGRYVPPKIIIDSHCQFRSTFEQIRKNFEGKDVTFSSTDFPDDWKNFKGELNADADSAMELMPQSWITWLDDARTRRTKFFECIADSQYTPE